MPLFARLGLLRTVEVSESDNTGTDFASHSAHALGITGATTSSDDFLDLCLQQCPLELMTKLIDCHLTNRKPSQPCLVDQETLRTDHVFSYSCFLSIASLTVLLIRKTPRINV